MALNPNKDSSGTDSSLHVNFFLAERRLVVIWNAIQQGGFVIKMWVLQNQPEEERKHIRPPLLSKTWWLSLTSYLQLDRKLVIRLPHFIQEQVRDESFEGKAQVYNQTKYECRCEAVQSFKTFHDYRGWDKPCVIILAGVCFFGIGVIINYLNQAFVNSLEEQA